MTSKREHKASASGAVTTLFTKNEYDHVGRLKETKHKVNSQTEMILARNEYNEVGQLKIKKQHSENKGTNFINATSYSYNERGWLLRTAFYHFTQSLRYDTEGTPQYNGNISRQYWRFGAPSALTSTFDYTYDKINRLRKVQSAGNIMYERVDYDERGNITTLVRNNTTLADTVATLYTYENSNLSNRLKSIAKGTVTNSYTYDVNGNSKTDRTGMNFRYNHLNLPDSAWNCTVRVGYLYDAVGTKLRKYSNQGGNRDYVGGIEYAGGNIEMIHTSEGYLQRNVSNNTYTYHYNLTDHLGNVRATLQRTSATAGTVIQKHDYYPFGKSKALLASGINKYLYNGKEVQSELGDQQDYGARFYDAEIGRWNVVDPLAEKGRRLSPYNYAFNNPVRFIDPDGQWPYPIVIRSFHPSASFGGGSWGMPPTWNGKTIQEIAEDLV